MALCWAGPPADATEIEVYQKQQTQDSYAAVELPNARREAAWSFWLLRDYQQRPGLSDQQASQIEGYDLSDERPAWDYWARLSPTLGDHNEIHVSGP